MGRNPTADTYMCTYTDHESAPPAAKLSLSQSQKKKTTKHRLSRTSGRGGRRQEQPSRTPGSPGARRGRRWPRPRSPPAHAAAPPGRAAAAAAGHPQRAAGKFPRRPRRHGRPPLTLSPVHHLLRAPLGHRLHGGSEPAGTSPRDRPQLLRPRTRPLSRSHPGSAAPGRPLPGPAPPAGRGPAPLPLRPQVPCPARAGPASCLESAEKKVPGAPAAAGPERRRSRIARHPSREWRTGRGAEGGQALRPAPAVAQRESQPWGNFSSLCRVP